nr:hypothetical protein CFP56_23819 [Quercus suber]
MLHLRSGKDDEENLRAQIFFEMCCVNEDGSKARQDPGRRYRLSFVTLVDGPYRQGRGRIVPWFPTFVGGAAGLERKERKKKLLHLISPSCYRVCIRLPRSETGKEDFLLVWCEPRVAQPFTRL